MPVAINFGDDVAIHEDAEGWMYKEVSGNESVAVLTDEHGIELNIDIPVANTNQIQYLTQEEANEVLDLL